MINLINGISLAFIQFLFLFTIATSSIFASDAPCNSAHDANSPCLIELPQDAIQKLKIDAGFGWGIFSGTIYNGNDDYHVTQLVISMTPKHDDHHMHMHANMSHDAKVHKIGMDLPPSSKGALSMALPDDVADAHDFNWKILTVSGYRIQ
jgi:hypothetical protein